MTNPTRQTDVLNAAVQEFRAATCGLDRPLNVANCDSKAATRGPVPSHPDSSVASTS